MHDIRATTDREVMHGADRQIPHRRRATHRRQRYHHRHAAIHPLHRLTQEELARHDPAAIRAQPGMVGRGVDRLIARQRGRR